MKLSKVVSHTRRQGVLNTYAVLTLACGHVEEISIYSFLYHKARKVPTKITCNLCNVLANIRVRVEAQRTLQRKSIEIDEAMIDRALAKDTEVLKTMSRHDGMREILKAALEQTS